MRCKIRGGASEAINYVDYNYKLQIIIVSPASTFQEIRYPLPDVRPVRESSAQHAGS